MARRLIEISFLKNILILVDRAIGPVQTYPDISVSATVSFFRIQNFHVHTYPNSNQNYPTGIRILPNTQDFSENIASRSQSFDPFGQRPDADQKDRSFEALGTRMRMLATKHASHAERAKSALHLQL